MPQVSIIVPNYNHARYLVERLESIRQQTFKDWELLILDDASTDNSREVIEAWLTSTGTDARTIYNTVNSGSVFKQWNLGVRETTAPYVWIAESDDSAEPCLLEKLVQRLDADKGLAFAVTRSVITGDGDEPPEVDTHLNEFFETNRWDSDFRADGRRECLEYAVRRTPVPNASAVLFRRSVYEQVGGAPESMTLCGDWMTWSRMLLVGDYVYVAEPLNHHRMHEATQRVRHREHTSVFRQHYLVVEAILSGTEEDPGLRESICAELFDATWTRMKKQRHWLQAREWLPVLTAARRVDPCWARRLIQAIYWTMRAQFMKSR